MIMILVYTDPGSKPGFLTFPQAVSDTVANELQEVLQVFDREVVWQVKLDFVADFHSPTLDLFFPLGQEIVISDDIPPGASSAIPFCLETSDDFPGFLSGVAFAVPFPFEPHFPNGRSDTRSVDVGPTISRIFLPDHSRRLPSHGFLLKPGRGRQHG